MCLNITKLEMTKIQFDLEIKYSVSYIYILVNYEMFC